MGHVAQPLRFVPLFIPYVLNHAATLATGKSRRPGSVRCHTRPGGHLRNNMSSSTTKAYGGLRRTVTALKKLPDMVAAGAVVSKAIDELFDERPGLERTLLDATVENVDEYPKVDFSGQTLADCVGKVV